jgi:hypothetical protein
MKTAYNYVTLRYVHDVVTGEFANVGVVVYSPEQRFLKALFTASYERLNAIFLKIDHPHFRTVTRYLGSRFEELADELQNPLGAQLPTGILQLVRQVLPPDDSSLQWSEAGGGLSENLDETLRALYARLVTRYVKEEEVLSRSDDEIAKPFKAMLERKHVSQRMQEKRIQAKDYQYEFQFGWKNSIWHVYEPVSFDLLTADSIVDKASKWLGRGVALQDATEKFKIHFLLGEPRQPGTREAFEHAQQLLKKIPNQPELVREEQLEAFAEEVAETISHHQDEPEAVVREDPPQQ